MRPSIYTEPRIGEGLQEFTLSVLTEDKAGLLNEVTIIFSRRKININSFWIMQSWVFESIQNNLGIVFRFELCWFYGVSVTGSLLVLIDQWR